MPWVTEASRVHNHGLLSTAAASGEAAPASVSISGQVSSRSHEKTSVDAEATSVAVLAGGTELPVSPEAMKQVHWPWVLGP